MPTEISTQLLPDEKKELDHFEKIIKHGIETFFAVGEALQAIKRARLYREQFPTFDEYCAVKWGIGRSQANRMVAAAEIVSNITASNITVSNITTAPIGAVVSQDTEIETREIIPVNEYQVRPLAALEPEQQVEAWEKAVEMAQGEQPTSAQVTEAVEIIKEMVKPTAFSIPVISETNSDADPVSETFSANEFSANDWIGMLEDALRSIQDNGLVYMASGVRCVSGCRVQHIADEYVHNDDCLLGIALAELAD